MSQANVDAVRRAHEAFDRGDIGALLEELDPEVRWESPETLPQGGVWNGHEEVGRFFQTVGETYEELDVQVGELIDAGDHVIDLGSMSGRVRGAGAISDDRYCFIWKLGDGKVVSFTEYQDTAKIAEARRAPATA
jgi:ketosteroid isomerase-like protein